MSTHLHLNSLPESYTYESEAHASISTIDHIICPLHLLCQFYSSSPVPDHPKNTSDHLPICAVFRIPSVPQSIPTTTLNPRPSAPDWSGCSVDVISLHYTRPLQHPLGTLLHSLPAMSLLAQDPRLIDDSLASLTSTLLSASNSLPRKEFVHHRSPHWGPELKAASSECKRCHRVWVSCGRPHDVTHPARCSYKEAKKHFRTCLRLHKRNIDDMFFASLDIDSGNSQRFFRQIRRHTNPSSPPIQRLSHGNSVYDGVNILEGWASYFEALSAPSDAPLTAEQASILSTCSNIASTRPDAPELLTVEEVEATIASLSSGKAAGHDSVMNEHIKFGGSSLPPIITLLFNAILLSGYIPVCFRHGVIIPIPKDRRKDQTDPSNYRGISLLSSISKLFEKLILHRLEDLQSTLNPLQGGFRKGVSCLHTAFIFQEAVASLREQKKKAYVAFLDVRKAFDTVWHPGLMVKLHSKNIPLYLWHLLFSWYSCLTSSVLWCSNMSRGREPFYLPFYILYLSTSYWITSQTLGLVCLSTEYTVEPQCMLMIWL